MGFPHPTIDLPGRWPNLAHELSTLQIVDRNGLELTALVESDDVASNAVHVCATAWVLSPDRTHTVLVRHKRLGWSTPGGHIERHENSREAALRELHEETGLTRFDVMVIGDAPAVVHRTDTRIDDAPHTHWNIGWLVTCSMEAPLSHVEGAAWFAVDEVIAGSVDGPPDLAHTLHRLIVL